MYFILKPLGLVESWNTQVGRGCDLECTLSERGDCGSIMATVSLVSAVPAAKRRHVAAPAPGGGGGGGAVLGKSWTRVAVRRVSKPAT